MKHVVYSLIIVSLLISAVPISAAPAERATYAIPQHAKELSKGVYSLGEQKDPKTGKMVEGVAIVHYSANAKGGAAKGKPGGSGSCYAFLASGAKWKTVEPWVMNTSNSAGLSGAEVMNLETQAVSAWESASGANIFGSGNTSNANLAADANTVNDVNEIYFADVSSSGAIAVTIVWGYFSGPPQSRQLVEWDQIYDDTDFSWDTDGSADSMDFLNIAVHEVGHAAGMGHPSDSCSQETMFRFATEGETQKRTLNAGDIAGINALY